jgi:energy-coupling factor transporter ATP-binding protein EcfA2
MTPLPEASLERVLSRVAAVWAPDGAPHHLIYGQTGSGKTTLIKALLGLCPRSRVLVMDPKPHADPVWDGPDGDPHRWGRPVERVEPRFGFDGEPGGGPAAMWFRLVGSPDRADTARRFAGALATVAAEGHCVLVLDDVRETCRQLKLAEHVDSVMNLGRSAAVLAILAATETGYVSGRAQAGMTWVGSTSGLDAAKDGAALLGRSGREWRDLVGAVEPRTWIYADTQPATAGPVLVTA